MSTHARTRPAPTHSVPGQLDLFADVAKPRRGSTPEHQDRIDIAPAVGPANAVVLRPTIPEERSEGPDDHPRAVQVAIITHRRPETLSQLLHQVCLAPPSQRRSDLASAIRGVGSVLGRPLGDVPATPAALSPLLAAANPATGGISMRRWSRIRTHLRGALADAGYPIMPGRHVSRLSADWTDLAGMLTDRRLQHGLSRAISYFSRRAIAPDEVSQSAFDEFLEALRNESLQARPEQVFRTAVDCWNSASNLVADWPSIKIEARSDERRYALGRHAFSESFISDVDAYLGRAADFDPFSRDYHRQLRPTTIRGRRNHIMQVASALLATGYGADDLTDLSVLVQPTNAEAALKLLLGRHGGQRRPQVGSQARTLLTIARQWVRAPQADLAILAGFTKGLAVTHKGMAPNVLKRLRQFDLPANTNALLTLPSRVMDDVRKVNVPDRHDALRVMLALAVELLTLTPLRMANLTTLELTRHFHVVRRGRERAIHITVPPEEMKNGRELQMPLPASCAHMLATFWADYRPLLFPEPSLFIFQGRQGRARSPSALGHAISKFLRREAGLVMNPHLFRQFAADIAVRHTVGGLETARLMLGHASSETTLRHYVHIRTDQAFKNFDAAIARLRREADPFSFPSLGGKPRELPNGA